MRALSGLLALGLALVAVNDAAIADSFPSRPIKMIVGFPPGGAADLVARLSAEGLSAQLGQQVVVENRTGSGGNLAGEMVAQAPPDGYTLLQGVDNLFMTNPHLYRMSIDPLKDFVPVASLVSNQLVLAVNPSVPATNLKELVALAKSSKPPLFYASIGNGSQHHLSMEMFKQMAGIELTHVPYRGGGPAATAMLANEVAMGFGGGSLVPIIKAGKLRGIASGGKVRNPLAPDLPIIHADYPGFEAVTWHGLFVPAGTPQPIIDRLRVAIAHVLAQPEFAERLGKAGAGEPYVTAPEEFAARIRTDHEKFGNLIRTIGVKVD